MMRLNSEYRDLVMASGNQGKICEFRKLFAHLPINLESKPSEVNIAETGKTFAQNARLKALGVAQITGKWSLADDSGLSVSALLDAPGVHSSRYARSDPERIARLLKELEFIDNRTAYFSAALCIASPEKKILLEVEARCKGFITTEPRGQGGFGYDPIFEVMSTGLTFAEMNRFQKQKYGHRGKAFSLLEPGLKKLLVI